MGRGGIDLRLTPEQYAASKTALKARSTRLMSGSTARTSQIVLNQAIRGGIPLVQRLFFKLKLLRSPDFCSCLCVVKWELILSPDPKRRFIFLP